MKVPLRCYPVSKPSKLQVVGSIPQHWTEERAKFYFHEVDERSVTGQEELLSVSHVTGVTSRRSKSITMFMAESNVGHKVCRPGDLVVNTMWAWMAALGVAKQDGLVSPAYGVYRPIHGRSLSPRYTDKLLRTPIYADEYFIRSTGIRASRLRLYPDQFLRIPIICPPSDEQAAIVRFLDHVDRKFRRFIQAKRRLIELLNEQKQSIINQAVTRGLDHDATFRASGIDWLGDVPEHWEVCRLRNVVTNVTSGSRGWSSYAADEGPLFLRIANLRRNALELRFDDVVRLALPETAEAQRTRVKAGDILISITAYIGSMAVVPSDFEEAYVSQHVARCRPRDGSHNPRWLGYVLLSQVGQTHGRLSLYGGTKDGLSLDDVKNYPLLLPPRSEQDRLVDWIDQGNSTSDAAILRIEHEINLIREYRTRLTSDVVTGKLDVRGAAERLPLELDEIASEGEPQDFEDPEELDDEASELISATANED